MKTQRSVAPLSPAFSGLVALAGAALLSHVPLGAQTTYQWNGTTNSTWTTATNWQSGTVGVTGSSANARLNVWNGAGQALIYSATQGTTVYANATGRGLVISNATGSVAGSMEITGGSFSTLGSFTQDVIGNNAAGTLTISGGTFIGAGSAAGGTILGINSTGGTSTLNISGTGTGRFSTLQLSAATAVVNLNGGTLAAESIIDVNDQGVLPGNTADSNTTFNFNGGTLQARATQAAFLGGLTLAQVRTGGAVIDTNGFDIGISQALLHEAALGATLDGGLTKKGSGTLTLSGTNTYTGITTISGGVLSVATIGNGGVAGNLGQASNAAANLVLNGGTLQYTGATASTDRNFTLGAGTTSTIDVTTNTLTISGASTATTGALTKAGAGTLILSGANSYTGLTTVSDGALSVTSTGSLASSNALTIESGGTADFANVGQTLGAVSNANTTTNALNFSAATGTITLASLTGAGNTRFGSNGTITGGISTGTVTSVGALNANISGGSVTAGGLLTGTISNGTVGAGSLSSTSITGGTNTITGAASITTLNGGITTVGGIATIGTFSSGTVTLNGATSSITTLNGGTVNLGTNAVLTVNNGSTAGSITGSGSLTKASSDTLTLASSGTYSYTGGTNVNAGKLVVNGNISTSNVTVADGATLGGSGSVGALTVQSGGIVGPGNSPGTLTVNGNYSQAGTLIAEITGLNAGTQHDQINVIGSVTLSGLLDARFTAGSYQLNDMIFLILNDGNDLISGTFSGLAQNDLVTSYGGFDWVISYNADSSTNSFTGGNDVALRAIPETSVSLLGGLSALTLLRRRRK